MDTVLLTGATGFLGRYLVDELRARGLNVRTAGRAGCEVVLDLDDPASCAAAVRAEGPAFVVNCGAMSRMSDCQVDPPAAMRANAESPRALAAAARETNASCRFLQVSTDLVFDGENAPYRSDSRPRPLSVYGMSKAGGESLLVDDLIVVRVPLLFGRSFDGARGATDMLRMPRPRTSDPLVLYANEFRTPLHVSDAAVGISGLLLDRGQRGIRHLGGHERVSRWELAKRFCRAVGLPFDAFREGVSEDPRRPRDVSLVGDWVPGRGLDEALVGS